MGIRDALADRISGGGLSKSRAEASDRLSILKSLVESVSRPVVGGQRSIMSEESDVRLPEYAHSMDQLYAAAWASAVTATAITALRLEALRRGGAFEERYASKCVVCGKEYDDIQPDQPCPECQGVMVPPDSSETKFAEELFKKCNDNHQSVEDVLGEFYDDLNVVDDAYIIKRKEYDVDDLGNIISARITEILSGDPRVMRLVADSTGKPGGKWYTCLAHREFMSTESGACPECGRYLYDVHYVAVKGGSKSKEVAEAFVEGEVIHKSLYCPSLMYGKAPIQTLWFEVTALIHMNRWIRTAWERARLPKGVLSVATANPESFMAYWKMEELKVKSDPHHIPVLPVEPGDGGAEISFVPFMPSLAEMEHIGTRDELRMRISAFYGVPSLFMGDVAASGGLNSEQEQVVVLNRRVEALQRLANEVLADICEDLKMEGHVYALQPSEERDEKAELEREAMKIANAQAMKALGFKVTRDESGEFEYEEAPPAPSGYAPTESWDATSLFESQSRDDDLSGMPEPRAKADAPQDSTQHRVELKVERAFQRAMDEAWAKAAKSFDPDGDLKSWVKETSEACSKAVTDIAEQQFKSALKAGFEATSKSYTKEESEILKTSIGFETKPDDLFVSVVRASPVWDSFKDLSKEMSKRLSIAIKENLGADSSLSLWDLLKVMREQVQLSDSRLETIARTESQAFAMAGRELAYVKANPSDTWTYDWSGPDDHRTTPLCREIKEQVRKEGRGRGVKLDRLKRIVREVSSRHMSKGWQSRDWVAHPSCRHGPVRSTGGV